MDLDLELVVLELKCVGKCLQLFVVLTQGVVLIEALSVLLFLLFAPLLYIL